MDSLIEKYKSLIKKIDFDRIKDFNKEEDILFVRFSLNSHSEDFVKPEILSYFTKILKEQGYKVIAFPKESDITVENKENIQRFIKTAENNLKDL